MKNLILIICLLAAGCTNSSGYYLTPVEVVESIDATNQFNEKLISDISILDEQVRQLRSQIAFIAQRGLIEKPAFLRIREHLLAADYFVAKSWVALIEKNQDSTKLYNLGNDELKRAQDEAVTAVYKKNSM